MVDDRAASQPPAELTRRIERLLEAELGRSPPAVGSSLSAHLDSVQLLSLMVAIEDHFQICFDPEDEAKVTSLEDVVCLVHAKLTDADGPDPS